MTCHGGYAQNHGHHVKPRDLVTMYFNKGKGAKKLQEKIVKVQFVTPRQ